MQDGLHFPSRVQWLTRNSIILGLWFLFMFAADGPVQMAMQLRRALNRTSAATGSEADQTPQAAELLPRWAEYRLTLNTHVTCAATFFHVRKAMDAVLEA